MNKTELLVTPASISHLEELIEAGADAFLVGELKRHQHQPRLILLSD